MPDLTIDQLSVLASSGASNREITAILRRAMTPDEQATADRARLVAKIKRKAAKQKPSTAADRVHKQQSQHALVDWTECEDLARRDRLERNPEAWLKWYCGETFTRPFEIPHRAIIGGAMNAIRTGGRFAVAGERGIGKSAVLWGVVLMLALSGETAFPVCLPWDARAQKRALRFWKNALCFNDRIGADYPHICNPFRHSRGVSQRLMATVWRVDQKYRRQPGVPEDGQETGASLAVSGGLIVLPDDRGCIGGATINGGCRGLNHPKRNGGLLRPSLVLLDDVQDRKVARSAALVSETVSKIDSDVAAMGEAGTNLPMLMSGNCIVRDDVMEQYLSDDRWESARIPCVQSWPDKWDEGKGEAFKLWQEWHGLYQAGKGAVTFYRRNKAAMTRGMVLTAPSAFRKGKGVPDAFCGAMLAYFKMGPEAFAAEKQQAPLSKTDTAELTVTPSMIRARAIGPDRGTAPEDAIKIIAGADVNPGATSRLGPRITWAVGAFSLHQSCCLIAYGMQKIEMPHDPTVSQQVSASYAALNALRLSLVPFGVQAFIYDARGWMNKGVSRGQALGYAKIRLPGCDAPAMPAEGWSNESYRPTHKTAIRAFEGGHVGRDRVEQQTVEWLAWNSDWVNLKVLRGWIAAPGAPGACILHGGRHDEEFCAQVSRRAYIGTIQKHTGLVYDWIRQPGEDDFGDAIAMAYVGAAWQGVGTAGSQNQSQPTVARVVISRPSHRMFRR